MTLVDIVDLSSDDEPDEVEVKAVKLEAEAEMVGRTLQPKRCSRVELVKHQMLKTKSTAQGNEENGSVKSLNPSHNFLDQGQSPAEDTCLSSTISMSPAPICRQFWKAGNYDDGLGSKVALQNGKNYLQVHPMFLHSNATSHKWAFGAIAELLDNAIDEIQNGATFVVVDEISNPRDGNPALLIQDDGGGMDPIAMRGCLSFGFSEKTKSSIGRYGNGFKTSTMRLGADVIVFSRHLDKRVLTQSIGLLSYTFLRKANYDRIVVPMVHYEFNTSTGTLDFLHGKEHFMSNLLMLLQWSPFATEAELLKQFDDIGSQGTKVIVYNLWANDDGIVELDFNTDPKDIIISGDTRKIQTIPAWKSVNEQHIGNRYHYSLRVYLSILYLRIPASFRIILRGEVVEHHNIANDLKFPQFIVYKPQNAGAVEGQIITTIGFLKEAPNVNIHGFNIYHKNRLILPFWQVVSYADSRGRGVVGVLETNFIEPTHNKQDFEKTSLFQKLESRLKEMTWEYWDYHCGLIGYQVKKKHPIQKIPPLLSSKVSATSNHNSSDVNTAKESLIRSGHTLPNTKSRHEQGLQMKRKELGNFEEIQKLKRQAVGVNNLSTNGGLLKNQEATIVLEENEKLHAKCLEYKKEEEELKNKVTRLKSQIEVVDNEYSRLLAELQEIEKIKQEKGV
ncbi:protein MICRORCHIDIA 6-like [Humulus lupulus]|uniref:protein MICRORCHIDIA 6-like n=1 Tax=Humulus lupulus TaxID=3486 RepID=UPI002B412254|nr:protein MICRORCHIDIA 6-like [Humulus lupulus]XP_062116234.1 protein MICRORCHIDIA 6-like [Humulus lupulus]XP_062116235.1 protein MICRORCHIDIA 6-like [Humulus lupulus]